MTVAMLAFTLAGLVAGCGRAGTGRGTAGAARRLLGETFSGHHLVASGVLDASLTVTPMGSGALTGPISLDFGGPFQSRGAGRLGESDFAVAIHFEGHTGQVSVLSTGTAGYVQLGGSFYRLPAATFARLESGFASVGAGASAGTGSGAGSLSHLGIHPQDWLADPEIVGTIRLGGVLTDHIHGTLAVAPLLRDLSTLLARASTVSSSASQALRSITPAEQTKLAGEVRDTSFDLWTGASDHTVRRLEVAATLPVSPSTSGKLGGLTSARIVVDFGYGDIGRPESVSAPSSSLPYPQFQAKISEIVEEIEHLAVADAQAAQSGG